MFTYRNVIQYEIEKHIFSVLNKIGKINYSVSVMKYIKWERLKINILDTHGPLDQYNLKSSVVFKKNIYILSPLYNLT